MAVKPNRAVNEPGSGDFFLKKPTRTRFRWDGQPLEARRSIKTRFRVDHASVSRSAYGASLATSLISRMRPRISA